LVGSSKELSAEELVLSKEVHQSTSPINYVLMVTEDIETLDEMSVTEAELFIKRLFVQGDYKHYADKFQLSREDLRKILYEAALFLGQKGIPCTIALILKPQDESRSVYVSRTGTGTSFIINAQTVRILNEDEGEEVAPSASEGSRGPVDIEKPKIYTGKLKKEDTLLLCSESLSSSLELNFIQRTVTASKGPEEMCKKLLHSASGTGRKDNISVAAFNGSVIRKTQEKERISGRTLLLMIVPPLLVLAGLLGYNLFFGNKEKPLEPAIVETVKLPPPPPEIKKDPVAQPTELTAGNPGKEGVKKPVVEAEKKVKKEIILEQQPPAETVKKYKNVNFIVTGSLVMISNWESVRQDISYISWDKGITEKAKIHRYPDYNSIPSSVTVTYKDNSTKRYTLKK
jgi:hypothetical protein